jgi:membrane fusion protein (multidrug efflux system)
MIQPDAWRKDQLMTVRSFIFPVVVVTALLATGCGSGGSAAKTNAAAPPPPAVTVVEVSPQTVPIYSEFVGSTFAEKEVQINARVNGYILARHFNPGDIVREGQLIYTLDPATYQAEVNRLRAEVARTEAQLKFARDGVEVIRAEGEFAQAEANLIKADQDVNRVKPLVSENALPEQDLDTAIASQKVAQAVVKARKAALDQQRLSQQTQIDQGEAVVNSAKASLSLAELDLSYTQIRSPVTGRIGETTIQTGGLATANSPTPLTRISPLDPIYVEFKVGERDYLDYIRKEIESQRKTGAGQTVAPLRLVLADGAVYDKPGQYRYADRAVDVQTGTLKLIGTFPNPDRMLLPGQFSRIRLRSGVKDNVFVVPQRAIIEMQGLRQLMVVDKSNKVAQKTVNATERFGPNWVIESGLQTGDRVIVDGLQKARPGAPVTPKLIQIQDLK